MDVNREVSNCKIFEKYCIKIFRVRHMLKKHLNKLKMVENGTYSWEME